MNIDTTSVHAQFGQQYISLRGTHTVEYNTQMNIDKTSVHALFVLIWSNKLVENYSVNPHRILRKKVEGVIGNKHTVFIRDVFHFNSDCNEGTINIFI